MKEIQNLNTHKVIVTNYYKVQSARRFVKLSWLRCQTAVVLD